MRLRITNYELRITAIFFAIFLFPFAILNVSGQENPPAPSAPRAAKIPLIQESVLPNGLRVVVVERKNVPLVSATLLIKNGASLDNSQPGLANMTASMLEKGTKTKTATQIAEAMEFLGGNLSSGANWNNSTVSFNITSDKVNQAMAIMSDIVLNPAFSEKEITLLKKQVIDDLNVALKQPGTLSSFVAARYTFNEFPAIGTPESLAKLTKTDISNFYKYRYDPNSSVLIFVGDITQSNAINLSKKYFLNWAKAPMFPVSKTMYSSVGTSKELINRFLVIDLPDSGQAAVTYANKIELGRVDEKFYSASVLNSVLGGGYSSRLNQEIRIKRGLSYGAGSSFAWRDSDSNFSTRAQTKNVSAAQVAELVAIELNKLTDESVQTSELVPRKLTLNGDFGRDLASNSDLLSRIAELYTFGLKTDELNSYIQNVNNVTNSEIKDFAKANLKGGDMIIVGDYKVFADDLKKRFPNQKIEVISASNLDLNNISLMKSDK